MIDYFLGSDSSPIKVLMCVCDKVTYLDKIRKCKLQKGCKSSENHMKRSNSMNIGLEKIMDFAVNIDKLDLANLAGEVMDEIMEFQFFYFQKNIAKGQTDASL